MPFFLNGSESWKHISQIAKMEVDVMAAYALVYVPYVEEFQSMHMVHALLFLLLLDTIIFYLYL